MKTIKENLNSAQLEQELEDLQDIVDSGDADPSEREEYKELLKLCELGRELSDDWDSGVTLIHPDNLVEETMDHIEETCEIKLNEWPYFYIDLKKAAEEFASNMTCVEYQGLTYYLRG